MRIVLTGGGTGGHLFPLLAVVRALKKINQENSLLLPPGEGSKIEFVFLGPQTVGEENLTKEEIEHKRILAGKIRRYISGYNFLDVFKLPLGLLQALWHLFWFMPNVVFSKGGYGSVPVVLTAWLYRLPVLIHESDARPGLANKLCAKFAKRIAISFAEAAKFFPEKKTALTGNPIRNEMINGSKEEAKKIFGLSGQKPVLLILGGSQGAQTINDIVFASLNELLKVAEIIHQCGPASYQLIKQLFNNTLPSGYFLYPFLDENQLRHAYAIANLIISRAGAGSIAEIAAAGKPSVLIPIANSAGDHQNKNALAYAQSNAASIMEQENLTPHLFVSTIVSLLRDEAALQKMAAAAKNFSRPDAARQIAQELLNIAKW